MAVPAVSVPIQRVFLAPGHGLSNATPGVFDEGAQSCYGQEHDIVAQLADRLTDLYFLGSENKSGPAFTVTVQEVPSCSEYCRKKYHPTFSHLAYIIRWLNDVTKPFDYVLSLHMNEAECEDTSGVEVYYSKLAHGSRRDQAALVARAVATSLGIPNRGAYPSDSSQHSSLGILDATAAPALLIELGFITNKADVDAVKSCGVEAVMAAIKALRGDK